MLSPLTPGISLMSRLNRRHGLFALSLLALSTSWMPLSAAAQAAWPARPIRIVVAYPPGGLSDNIARALADTAGMNIIRVHIGLDDRSTTLDRLAAGLAKKVAR